MCRKISSPQYKLRIRVITKRKFLFFYIPFKYKKKYFKILTCLEHYLLIKLMRILYVIFYISTVIFAIPIVSSFFTPSVPPDLLDKSYIISFFSLIILFSLRIFTPIRIIELGKHHFILSIRNNNYANEFSLINNINSVEELSILEPSID